MMRMVVKVVMMMMAGWKMSTVVVRMYRWRVVQVIVVITSCVDIIVVRVLSQDMTRWRRRN